MPILWPLLRYSLQSSACRSQTDTPTKSAPASRPPRPTASRKLATFLPSPTSRRSTSVARFPIRFTVFMPRAYAAPCHERVKALRRLCGSSPAGGGGALRSPASATFSERTSRVGGGHGPLHLDDGL